MLEYFNNQAQPLADDVKITDYDVTTADGATLLARWYRRPMNDTGVPMPSVQYRLTARAAGWPRASLS